MAIFKSLNREQKEAIGLLQVGTFLEYFDLMLYVHMAVLLNELFFPKTDPHTASLVAAFAFCSTYILRPFGALIFGYLGDRIGRKSTVIITTSIMSLSCLIMANVPTYAQAGIAATWIITGCRIVQGLSSMGEINGAYIYLTEITKAPFQYPVVSLIVLASSLGSMSALGVASLVTHFDFNWRLAFWGGATIAVIGSLARTRLRETPEFADYKRRRKNEIESRIKDPLRKEELISKANDYAKGKQTPFKTMAAYFFVECSYAMIFYVTFIYFNATLKSFGYSPADIIAHNFMLSIVAVILNIVAIWLVTFIHPLAILNVRAFLAVVTFAIIPLCLAFATSPYHVLFLQLLLSMARGGCAPGDSIFIKKIHVGRRFTFITFNYALSRAVMHVLSAFGLVYLTDWFGYYGVWFIGMPVSLAYWWGVRHFQKLEEANNPSSFVSYKSGFLKQAA
ncbi:MFS transporter [Candidatus Finniella inopinata]|uniref:MFS transporter n=1 Tax=Candidatus Finniella inopinata TaxID=1696036 RepID=A0A4Q7DHC4_9PROT|nr:MFS transporter [Candidatus Finniella inopinata]RZI45668.1 MFS transporter [Candidatus Finniella inopinata]